MTTLALLCSLCAQCPDEPKARAAAAWQWAVAQQNTPAKKDCPCAECAKMGCSCSPCTCASMAKAKAATVEKKPATLIIELPATAKFWIQNEEQYMTGETRRVFESPPLEVGKVYHYTVRARDIFGTEFSAVVDVEAGKTSRVSFMRQATTPAEQRPESRLPAVQFQNLWPGSPRMSRSGSC